MTQATTLLNQCPHAFLRAPHLRDLAETFNALEKLLFGLIWPALPTAPYLVDEDSAANARRRPTRFVKKLCFNSCGGLLDLLVSFLSASLPT
jgi:hypothetical protein